MKEVKAPKEFHSLLDEMYNKIYKDRKYSNSFGLAKQKKMFCSDSKRIIPFEIPFKSIYKSYIISITESK